jgi:hypothetical protein
MNRRYKEDVARAPNLAEVLRQLLEHAHEAEADMSGATPAASARPVLPRGATSRRWGGRGRPLTQLDEARIIDTKLSNPDMGVRRLKRDAGLTYGHCQITRVLRDVGLMRKPPPPPPPRDVDFWVRTTRGNVYLAEAELALAQYARLYGFTGRVAAVERLRRGVEKAKRKAEWWKKEKSRRERAEKMKGH